VITVSEINIWQSRLRVKLAAGVSVLALLFTAGCSEVGQEELSPGPTEASPTETQEPEITEPDFGNLTEVAASGTAYFDAAYIEEEDVLVAVATGFPVTIHHLDPSTLQEIAQIPMPSEYFLTTFDGFGGDIRGRHFSPDGRQLIFTTGNPFVFNSGACIVVDSLSGETLAELPTAATCNFAYSADSTLLFHSDVFAGAIRSYDTTSFEVVDEIPASQGTVHLVAPRPGLVYSLNDLDFEAGLNPAGTKLNFVDAGGEIAGDTPIGSPVATLVALPGYQWLLVETLDDNGLIAVDAETGAVAGFLEGYESTNSAGFLSFVGRDGTFLLGTNDGQLFELDNAAPAVRRSLEVGVSQINALVISPDSKLLFVFGDTTKAFSTVG
jgi:WD40 repeat protein